MLDLLRRFRRYLTEDENNRQAVDAGQIFSSLPVLQTERLILRPMRMRDAQDIFSYASDEQVAEHVLWQAHKSIADSRSYLRYIRRQYRLGLPGSYGIELKETGHLIGTIGFMWYQPADRSAEIGYSLSRAYWGQGLMTEAVQAILHMGFDTLHLHRIEAMHETTNPSSGRVMEKCGMQREGLLRHRVYNKGHYSDVVLWSILETDHNT